MINALDIPLYLTWIAEAEGQITKAKRFRRRVDAEIGTAFRAARAARGLTLRDFAELVGHSAAYLSDLENGQSMWTAKKLEVVGKAMESVNPPKEEPEEKYESDQWV